MDKQLFYDRLIATLDRVKSNYTLDSVHDALIVWFAENCLLLDPDEVKSSIVIDSKAEGVDAVLVDHTRNEVCFLAARTVERFENTDKNFPETDVKSTLSGIEFLLKGDYKGKITTALENMVDEYHELVSLHYYATRVIFVALKAQPIDDKYIEHFRKECLPIQVDFHDFSRLQEFYEKVFLPRMQDAPEVLSFEIPSAPHGKDSPHQSRVFTCRGRDLARMYDEHGERIFQRNVRYSLGMRSRSINGQILETATNGTQNKDFWYFNNGITIVCKKIEPVPSGKMIRLHQPQIINGAQTTYALHEALNAGKLTDEVEVLIKAIATSDDAFIDSVTLYTNSQNSIRLRDLCSNDEIQRKLQKIMLAYGYFYQRKRGETCGPDYAGRVISNETAAQAYMALYLDKPSQAKAQKGAIFSKEPTGYYGAIFDESEQLLAEKFLMSWKLLGYVEGRKREYKKRYDSVESLPMEDSSKQAVYRFDFLLHSEYFILNLLGDFLKDKAFDVCTDKKAIMNVVGAADSGDKVVADEYEAIKTEFAALMDKRKTVHGYYHNKFFKNEKSAGLIRDHFNKSYPFVQAIP